MKKQKYLQTHIHYTSHYATSAVKLMQLINGIQCPQLANDHKYTAAIIHNPCTTSTNMHAQFSSNVPKRELKNISYFLSL